MDLVIIFFYRFLGKYMSQYISVLVEEGESRTDIISKGFDYERWVKTQTRTQSSQHRLKIKEEIVAQLVTFIEEKLTEWCLQADVKLMCEQSHKQLLQMRVRGGGRVRVYQNKLFSVTISKLDFPR